jgi:signal transduction histidine kinase
MFFFWLDITALAISAVVVSALLMLALASGIRKPLNYSFAYFAAAQAAWVIVSLLLRLSLWFDRGNPVLLAEIVSLALSLTGPPLLLFTSRYVGHHTWGLSAGAIAGVIAMGVLSVPLFRHQLVSNPHLTSTGSTAIDIKPLGLVLAPLPILYFVWSLILFWRERHRDEGIYLALSVFVLLAGFIVGGIVNVPLPILSITGAVGVAVLGYGVVSRQLFNPLRERTRALQREIAERGRVEETLRQYAAQLEERNEELDAFAHMVAHDLDGPLAHMVGFAEVLKEDHTSLPAEEVSRYLRIIAQSGRKMSRIIDALLLLASVRQLEQVLMEPLDTGLIIDEALARLADQRKECQAEIVLPSADSWPAAAGYALWVEEVWFNYLSNALKYGGEPPRVELGVTQVEEGLIQFWVRDNGPGITPEQQARLFKPFTRLGPDVRRAKGHGLGLSIVQLIVEKLGGRVGVESVIGQGSRFWFSLPRFQGWDKSTGDEGKDAVVE